MDNPLRLFAILGFIVGNFGRAQSLYWAYFLVYGTFVQIFENKNFFMVLLLAMRDDMLALRLVFDTFGFVDTQP